MTINVGRIGKRAQRKLLKAEPQGNLELSGGEGCQGQALSSAHDAEPYNQVGSTWNSK